MKVVLLSYLFGANTGGGAVAAVRYLARGLRERGVEVTVITTHDGPQETFTTPEDVRVHALPPQNLYWVGDKDRQSVPAKILWQLIDVWNPRLFTPVKQLLELEAPDVVHIHKLRGLSSAAWSAAAAAVSGPILQTCHDYEVMSPEGTLTGRLGQMAINRDWRLRPYQAVRAHVSNHVDAVTAPSQFTLSTISDGGYFRGAAKIVVPNSHGLSNDELRTIRCTDSHTPPTQTIRFLYLGRLEATKGVRVLLDAYTSIADIKPQIELHVAGYGSQEAQLRKEFENHPRIWFHGALFGEAKAALMRSCDVVVVPSVWPEVFGIVVIEAHAFGKPVIGSNIGGIPELIEEGKTGFLVPHGDSDALATAMLRFVDTSSLAKSMSEACFNASEAYSIEEITERYLEVYADAQSISSGTDVPRLGQAVA